MILEYPQYDFTAILGWSASRFELFDKCKRRYFYTYYGKYDHDIPRHTIERLKHLTSIPLEIGNVVHDVIEAFLNRLQKDDSEINKERFFSFAREKTEDYFEKKTCMELYYNRIESLPWEHIHEKIGQCLHNFISSPWYTWLFMKAMTNKDNWLIEPAGYGETRLHGMKAYCKMDFLFPVDGDVYIFDWKTGKRDPYKHRFQLLGYAAAANNNFSIPWQRLFPRIVYLYPEFDEFAVSITEEEINTFFETIIEQLTVMRGYCTDIDKNIPLPKEQFPLEPSPPLCAQCNFYELCFPTATGVTRSL